MRERGRERERGGGERGDKGGEFGCRRCDGVTSLIS